MNSKIIVVPDINYFNDSKEKEVIFNELPLENYYNFLEIIKSKNYENEIIIYIPEVVLCQLIFHHKNDLKKVLRGKTDIKLKNIGFDDLKKVEFRGYCNKLRNNYLKTLNILKIPEDKEKVFKEIFKRAIDKKHPFNSKSDSGFKSMILFLSILNFIKNDDKIILVSDKEKFIYNNRIGYENEFNDYFMGLEYSPSLHICSIENFAQWLNDKYNIELVF